MHLLILIAATAGLAAVLTTTSPASARSQGDEAGTLKGMRGPAQPTTSGAPKGKPGKAPDDEGATQKNKPSGTPKPR